MEKNVTLKKVPEDTHKKFIEFKSFIKTYGLSSQMYTAKLMHQALEEFLKDPERNMRKLLK